jgi:predicted nucleic acid-binding protein
MKSSKKSLVAERWVINASPVIALSRIGQVELLVRLPQQSVIPRSVADELLRAPEDDPARRAIEGGSFKIIETPAPPAQILAWDLGQGETAVLSYALSHPKWIAVLDDGAAHNRYAGNSDRTEYVGFRPGQHPCPSDTRSITSGLAHIRIR